MSLLEERQKECRLYVDHIGDILQNHVSNIGVYVVNILRTSPIYGWWANILQEYCANQSNAIKVLKSLRDSNAELASHLQVREFIWTEITGWHGCSTFERILQFATWTCQVICLFPVSLSVGVKLFAFDWSTPSHWSATNNKIPSPIPTGLSSLYPEYKDGRPSHGIDSTAYRSCTWAHGDSSVYRQNRKISRSYQWNNSRSRRSRNVESHLSKFVDWSRQTRPHSSDSLYGSTKTLEIRSAGESQEWTKAAGILVQRHICSLWLWHEDVV
jgi:hypothetical protein